MCVICVVLWVMWADTFAQNQLSECDGSLLPTWFAQQAWQDLQLNTQANIYVNEQFLEMVWQNLNTICIKNSTLWDEHRATKTMTQEQVIYSETVLDQWMWLYLVQIQWDREACEAYGIDCAPKVYADNDLPSPMVCFRCGIDESCGGDARCESVFGIKEWVDTLAESTDISSSADYRALYQKFRWKDENMLTLPASEFQWGNARQLILDGKLTIPHLWYHMCHELSVVYGTLDNASALNNASFSDEDGSFFQRCLTKVRDIQVEQQSEYVKILAVSKWLDHQSQVNQAVRDDMYRTFDEVMNTVNQMVSNMQELVRSWEKFTTTCSI